MSRTSGSTAKLYGAGGEEVSHSSVRPFHGSPLRSSACCALLDADDELDHQEDDADRIINGAQRGDDQIGLPGGDVVVLDAAAACP